MSHIKHLFRNHKTFLHVGILVSLWVLFFWRYFAGDPNRIVFPDGDFTQQFFIFRSIAFEQFAEGRLPLWSNCFFGGYPFHADPQSQIFYPPTLIIFAMLRLLGFNEFPLTALTIETVLHYLAIGAFSYFFLKKESKSSIGALIGSIAPSL